MPILVKDYTWSETPAHLVITVPLKGVKPSRADVFSTDAYIKVNFPPYLFEAHLYGRVVEEECRVRIGNGLVVFHLKKGEEGVWGQLCKEETKEQLMERREKAVYHAHQRAKEEREERAKKKREEEQFAIKEQMRLEVEEKERIEKEKQDERDKATSDLEKWNSLKLQKDIWTGKQQTAPPPLRKPGEISIRFTPRPFTTAARESKIAEEQEWLSKMAAARKIRPPETPEQTIDERNPESLKDRGAEFFKVGNYEAAINAYTDGINLNGLLPSLYSNRAACYLAVDKLELCVSDCCKALELYYPVVPSNYLSRARVFVRRGTAYARLGEYELAVQDYEAAIKLSPGDEKLREDYEKLKEHTPGNKII